MESLDKGELILKNIPLVKKIVSSMLISSEIGLDYDDMVGYGIVGLIEAIDKYDPSKNVQLSTYVYPRIKGAILDEIRKKSPLTRNNVMAINKYNNTVETFQHIYHREPTVKEISKEMNLSVRQVLEIKNNIQLLSNQDVEEILPYLEDKNIIPQINIIQEKEFNNYILGCVDSLKEKEKNIILLHYYQHFTFSKISKILGISESRVSQLHKKAISKLKESIKEYYKEV